MEGIAPALLRIKVSFLQPKKEPDAQGVVVIWALEICAFVDGW